MESIRVENLPGRNRGNRPELEVDWEAIKTLPVGWAVDLEQEWPHLTEGRKASSLVSTLRNHIKRKGLHGLTPIQRNRKVYITRTETETGTTEVS